MWSVYASLGFQGFCWAGRKPGGAGEAEAREDEAKKQGPGRPPKHAPRVGEESGPVACSSRGLLPATLLWSFGRLDCPPDAACVPHCGAAVRALLM